MAFAFAVFLALSATLLTISPAQKPRCGDFCTFRFCQANAERTVSNFVGPRRLQRDANIASQPYICRKIREDLRDFLNVSIRVVKTGEAEVHPAIFRTVSPRPFVPISQLCPRPLPTKFCDLCKTLGKPQEFCDFCPPAKPKCPKFSKSHFKMKEIRFPPIPGEKGVAREMSKAADQEWILDDMCVVLPVKKYNIVDDDDRDVVIRKVKTKKREDCISFRTVVPQILVELTWDSSDDLDLSVKEPNGDVINLSNPKSASLGVLIDDANVGVCNEDPEGREQVRWLKQGTPGKGKYTVTVRHFNNCGNGPTKWSLAVIIGGKIVEFKDGTSNKDNNKKITTLKFKF